MGLPARDIRDATKMNLEDRDWAWDADRGPDVINLCKININESRARHSLVPVYARDVSRAVFRRADDDSDIMITVRFKKFYIYKLS